MVSQESRLGAVGFNYRGVQYLYVPVRRVVMAFVGLALGVPAGEDPAAEKSHYRRIPLLGVGE